MLKLTRLIKNFKGKIAAGTVGAILVASPGVALAHGNHNDRDNGWSQRNSWSDNNRWDRHNHNDEWDQTCEERQAIADQKIANYKAKAQERFNGLGAYLFSQQKFVADNSLSIENYDKYNDKAVNAQVRAQAELDDITAPNIDCDRWEGKDKREIRQAKHDLREAMERFENSVQKLSFVISESVVISS